jgi:hypothetical protein
MGEKERELKKNIEEMNLIEVHYMHVANITMNPFS